jgi:hypothetical protein
MPRRLFAAALLVGAASCGSPTKPTPTPAQPEPTATRVELIGPSTISPTAGTVKFRAVATHADGSVSDVTDVAAWRSTPNSPQPIRFVRAGEFQITSPGEATVSVTFRGLSANQNLLVVPTGTFKLRGRVTTADGRPLPYTSVTVVEGIGSGEAKSWASSSRDFVLYGVAGPIVIETQTNGYGYQQFQVNVEPDSVAELTVRPLVPAVNLSGEWRLTLRASPACTELPPEYRERTYEARFDHAQGFMSILISAPMLYDKRFKTGGGSFEVPNAYLSAADRLGFHLPGVEGWDDIVGGYFTETIGKGRLEVYGTVNGLIGDRQFDVMLDGGVGYAIAPLTGVAFCNAKDHRLTFERR